MKIGDHPNLKPVAARQFLPMASGLFVLPGIGLKPSQLISTSRQLAQVSAIERVRAKADLHDRLFAARERLAAVAAGAIGPLDVRQAVDRFNSYVDALDKGSQLDRNRANEARAALAELRGQLAPIGIGVVGGRLAPGFDRLADRAEVAPEAISDAFAGVRDRLDPVFASHSSGFAIEAEAARARVPVLQSSASIGAALAGLTLQGAKMTQMLTRLDLLGNRRRLQQSRIARLQAALIPKPTVPGTILPGFPALGRPAGFRDGAEYELTRRTPGLAPGRGVVSGRNASGVPDFKPPRPVELAVPGGRPDQPPGQRADVAAVVREVKRRKEGRPVSESLALPSSVRRRLDPRGHVVPAQGMLRPVQPPVKLSDPEPVDRPERGQTVPELPPPTRDVPPVARPDPIPRNPGQALRDLLPANPLPPVAARGQQLFDVPAPPGGG